MKRTMNEITIEMTQLGYPIQKRRLIDWVQKGLLPHPRQEGLGREKGSVYYWTQPNILRQAITVYKLLEGYGRVKSIYLPLWLSGYDVPLEIVRQKLLDLLEKTFASLTQRRTNTDDPADRLFDLACKMMARWQRSPSTPLSIPADTALDLLDFLLNVFANPTYELSDEVLSEMAEAFIQAIQKKSDPSLEGDVDPAIMHITRQSMQFFQYVSLSHLRSVVMSATETELKQVHTDFRILAHAVRALLEPVVENEDEQALLEWFEYAVMIIVGPCVILAELSLRRENHGQTIDRIIFAIVDFCQRMMADQQLLASLRDQAATEKGEE